MPKINFYPEKRKSELGVLRVRNVPLLLFFSFEGKRLQFYTGERIDLKDWDYEHKKILSSHPENASINEHLDFLKRRVLEAYRDTKLSGQQITISLLRKRLKEVLTKGSASFFNLLIQFIEEKNSEWTLDTFRKIKTFYNHLRNFTVKTGIEPDLSGMDDVFFHKLIEYFRNDCHHIDSTIRKNIEVFMWFMNWALKKGYHHNYDLRKNIDKYLKLKTTSKQELFLSMDEIQAIINYSATNKKELIAKDVFLLACLTGLTCKELTMLRAANIEDNWIKVTSGRRSRSVPLVPQSRIIVEKYINTGNTTLFSRLYPYKINRYLKEIAKKTNLSREIIITKYINGKEQDASVPAYKLLTLSVARKTFLRQALNLGIDPLTLFSAAGYKTLNIVNLQSK
jgi:site-specific recombinase XerD